MNDEKTKAKDRWLKMTPYAQFCHLADDVDSHGMGHYLAAELVACHRLVEILKNQFPEPISLDSVVQQAVEFANAFPGIGAKYRDFLPRVFALADHGVIAFEGGIPDLDRQDWKTIQLRITAKGYLASPKEWFKDKRQEEKEIRFDATFPPADPADPPDDRVGGDTAFLNELERMVDDGPEPPTDEAIKRVMQKESDLTPDEAAIRVETHRTHCCVLHGCKYGDGRHCPVEARLTKQQCRCERCEDDGLTAVPDPDDPDYDLLRMSERKLVKTAKFLRDLVRKKRKPENANTLEVGDPITILVGPDRGRTGTAHEVKKIGRSEYVTVRQPNGCEFEVNLRYTDAAKCKVNILIALPEDKRAAFKQRAKEVREGDS